MFFRMQVKAINNFTCTPSRRAEDLAVMEEHVLMNKNKYLKLFLK